MQHSEESVKETGICNVAGEIICHSSECLVNHDLCQVTVYQNYNVQYIHLIMLSRNAMYKYVGIGYMYILVLKTMVDLKKIH